MTLSDEERQAWQREANRRYRETHRAEITAYQRRYYATQPDYRAYLRQYREEHREEYNAYIRQYRADHQAALQRAQEANADRRRVYHRAYDRTRRQALSAELSVTEVRRLAREAAQAAMAEWDAQHPAESGPSAGAAERTQVHAD